MTCPGSWLVTPGPAVFWILSQEHAPSTHVLSDNTRGDLGRFALQSDLTIKGKVLDTQGKPATGVEVEADKQGGIGEGFNLPVADHIRRTARTNDKGEFTMAPLPPGRYELYPQERGWDTSKDRAQQQKRPLPGVFVRTHLTLEAGVPPERIARVLVPSPAAPNFIYPNVPENNFIDREVFAKLRKLNKDRTKAFADMLWALINTREFILNH